MKRLALALVLLAVGGLAAFLAFEAFRDSAAGTEADTWSAEENSEETGGAALRGAGPEDATAKEADGDGDARKEVAGVIDRIRVRGRLVDGADKPLGDIGLQVTDHLGAANSPWQNMIFRQVKQASKGTVKATTGTDGTFSFEWDTKKGGQLAIHQANLVWAGRSPHFLASSQDLDLGDIRADKGALVAGRVLGPDGRAVAGAQINLWVHNGVRRQNSAKTDAEGRFELKRLMAGRGQLSIVAKGFLNCARQMQIASASEERGLEVELRRGRELVGVVVDDAGKAIPKANVNMHGSSQFVKPWTHSPNASMRTDAKGRFRFTSAGKGQSNVNASAQGHAGANKRVDPAAGEARIVLNRLASIAGRVVDQDGKGVANSQVRISRSAPKGNRRNVRSQMRSELEFSVDFSSMDALNWRGYRGGGQGKKTDKNGSFKIDGLRDGEVWLTVTGMHKQAVAGSFVVHKGQCTDGIQVRVVRSAIVIVHVVDPSGQPVRGARVVVSQPNTGQSPARRPNVILNAPFSRRKSARAGKTVGSGNTDQKGVCVIGGIDAGNYELTASHASWVASQPQALRVPEKGDVQAELALVAGGSVNILVADAQGRPVGVQGFRILRHGKGVKGGRTDASGRAKVGPLVAGEYQAVCVLTNGQMSHFYAPSSMMSASQMEDGRRVSFRVVGGSIADVHVVCPPRARLVGTVQGTRGIASQAAIVLMPISEKNGGRMAWMLRQQVATRGDGSYVIDGLKPGSYTLWVREKGSHLPHRSTVEIVQRTEHRHDISLRSGAIEVRILYGGGKPSSVRIQLTRADGQVYFNDGTSQTVTKKSGTDGVVRFEGVPPGKYRLRLSQGGFSSAQKDIEVGAGAVANAELEAQRTATLEIAILDDGKPAKGNVYVEMVQRTGANKSKQQNKWWHSRRRKLTGLRPGEWTVRVRRYKRGKQGQWGAYSAAQKVKLGGAKTAKLQFVLPK